MAQENIVKRARELVASAYIAQGCDEDFDFGEVMRTIPKLADEVERLREDLRLALSDKYAAIEDMNRAECERDAARADLERSNAERKRAVREALECAAQAVEDAIYPYQGTGHPELCRIATNAVLGEGEPLTRWE